MDVNEKVCPACAETVKAAAKVCKHCGLNFSEEKNKLNISAGTSPGSGCRTILFVFLGFIVFIFILGLFNGGSASNDRYNSMTAEQRSAEDYRRKTGLYPQQMTDIIKHCNEVPKPGDC